MYFQLNDLFALLLEKMYLLIYTLKVNTLYTPSKEIPYIHPQSKYLHTPSKVNTLHIPSKVNTLHTPSEPS